MGRRLITEPDPLKPVLFPGTVLVVAVVLSLAAQVVEAEQSAIGWIAAGFLAVMKIAVGDTGAAGAVPDSGRSGRVAVRDDKPPSQTAVDHP